MNATLPLGRRRFLALTTASLTGCNGRFPGTEPETIDGDRLSKIVKRDAPAIPETLPVAIDPAFIDAQVDDARQMLADVPAPLDAEEIPNGAIRERLNHRYESVKSRLDTVADAETPLERLERAGYATADVRGVQATWLAIDAGLTVEDIRENAPAVRTDVAAFVDRWSYVGGDPVRAIRVHARIEEDLTGAGNWAALDQPPREDGPFAVGEIAERLERARVSLASAAHVFDRFQASIARTNGLQTRLKTAKSTLGDRVRSRATDLPDAVDDPTKLVERDVDETAGVRALSELFEEARRLIHEVEDERGSADTTAPLPRLASGVLERHRALVLLQAFEQLRTRIEGGDDVAIESANDVATLREAAVEAVTVARRAGRDRGLVRESLPRFASRLRRADDRLEESSGEVTVPRVARTAADYVVVTSTCRELLPASAEVSTVVRTG